jgi:hypothetical protein
MTDNAVLNLRHFILLAYLSVYVSLFFIVEASPFAFPAPVPRFASSPRADGDGIGRGLVSVTVSPGVEHAYLLEPHKHSYFVFKMPSRNMPLWMYVTPCGGPVYWQLYMLNDFARAVNTHPKSEHFNHILHKRIPPLVELPTESDDSFNDQLVLLAGEENEKRMTFYANDILSDYVVVNISAPTQTTFRLFMSTHQTEVDNYYPPLPEDRQMNYTLKRTEETENEYEMNLSWNIPAKIFSMAPPADGKSGLYRYCAIVSRRRADYTICDDLGENLESIHCVNQSTNTLEVNNLRGGHH